MERTVSQKRNMTSPDHRYSKVGISMVGSADGGMGAWKGGPGGTGAHSNDVADLAPRRSEDNPEEINVPFLPKDTAYRPRQYVTAGAGAIEG